jgi:hypothetical protein
MNTEVLIRLALERTCPAGLPYTGDAPEEDHGHSDCWMYHKLIQKIRGLDAENKKLAEVLMGPYVTVNESKVEEVDQLLATHIGRLEIEELQSLLPPKKCESQSFDALWWAGLV